MTMLGTEQPLLTLEITNEYGPLPKDSEKLIEAVLEKAVALEGIDEPCEVSLLLTGGPEIRRLNAEFRDIDRETDVLSFPMNELQAPLAELLADEEYIPELNDAEGRIVLGDIAVNVSRAEEQAEEYGHSFIRELAFLCLHGMLHLLGYDHMTDEDEAVMRERQRAVLEALGVAR